MANILFIDRGIPNIGIAYMSSYLNKHNHNVHYFRASLKSMFVPNLEIEIDSYITDVLHEKVDIFCISIMAINWSWVKEKVKILKQEYPSIPVLVGGPFATTSPDVILNYSEVDYVCIGDGEKPLLDIANSIDLGSLSTDIVDICNISFKDNNVPVIKDMTFYVNNLDDYPFPDFSIFEGQFSKHYFKYPGIITSRGCPFSCTYCTCPGLKEIYSKVGNFVRQHSVEYMIEYLSKRNIIYFIPGFPKII